MLKESLVQKLRRVYRSEGVAGIANRVQRRVTGATAPLSSAAVFSRRATGTGMHNNPASFIPEITHHYMDDEFITWLKYIVPGGLHPGNVLCFDHAIKNLPDDSPIVEIGTFAGLSTNIFSYLKWRHNKHNTLITCDRWIFEFEPFARLGSSEALEAMKTLPLADTPLSHAKYREFVRDSYLRNVQMFTWEALPHTVELFSDEFFAEWEKGALVPDVFGRVVKLGGTIGFCYIDGNHSYDFTKRDFQNCDKYLIVGGFVLFDDSADDTSWGSAKAVQEIVEQEVLNKRRYELVMRNPNYLFRKIKP